MKKFLLGLALSAFFATPALSATCPTFVYGLVLTAAQWQACFDAKQNVLGYTPVNRAGDTMTGAFNTTASTSAVSGFNVAPGIVPSSPRNGDVWVTSAGIFARINGATVGPFTSGLPTITAHQLLVGNGAAAPVGLGSLGSATTLLHGNASGNPSFSAVNLATDITGTLPSTSMPTPGGSALGGVFSVPSTTHQWVSYIDTSGLAHQSRPAFADLSGTLDPSQIPLPTSMALGGILSGDCASHQFMNGVSSVDGSIKCAQPAFTDVSGSVAASQLPNPGASTLGGVKSLALVSHKWINSISTAGLPVASQPDFSDISGSVAASQLPNPGTAGALGGVTQSLCTVHRYAYQIDASGIMNCSQPDFSDLSGTLTASQIPTPTSGTLGGLFSASSVSHQWVSYVDTSGAQHQSQPAFTDISGSVAATQLPNPSATTLGGVKSLALTSHLWINSISTAGLPVASQPNFSDLAGTLTAAQIPNPSATTLGGIQSIVAASHKWINSISTSGVPNQTQPDFSDITGSVAASQLPAPGTGGALGGVTQSLCPVHRFAYQIDALGVMNCSQPDFSDLTGTGVVSQGGTGVATLASNGILYGNGTSPIQALAVNSLSTKKYLQQFSSGAPSWAQIAAADISGLATIATSGSASDLGSGTIPNARIVALPNANLANSTVTISGHAVSLGGSLSLASSDISGLGTSATVNTGVSGHTLGFLDGNNAWSGTDTFASSLFAGADFYLTGKITPALIVANQNNYAPTGYLTTTTIRISGDTGPYTITGLAGGSDGRIIVIENVGSNNLIIAENNNASLAANRFELGTTYDITFVPNFSMMFKYDGTASLWRWIGGSQLVTPGPGQIGGILSGNCATSHTFVVGYNSTGNPNCSRPSFADISSTPTTLSGYGITDAQGLNANLTALAALSSTGIVKRTGSNTFGFAVAGTDFMAPTAAATAVLLKSDGAGGTAAYTGTTCGAGQIPSAFGTTGGFTCSSFPLAGSYFANQGSTSTVLHGNASGNPSWGAVNLASEVTGSLPNANLANSTVTISGHSVSLGGSLSLLFSDISSTPTTVAGYGITDALTTAGNLAGLASPVAARGNLGLGQPYLTTQFDKTTTSISGISGMGITAASGNAYYFRVVLFIGADAADGFRFRMGGTLSVSSITYTVSGVCDTTGASLGFSVGRLSDITTALAYTAGCTSAHVIMEGVVQSSATGTFIPQFALGTGSGATSSVQVNSSAQYVKLN